MTSVDGDTDLSASSWPGLPSSLKLRRPDTEKPAEASGVGGSRPSTSWQIEKKGVDATVKPGHDESVEDSTT